MKTKVFFSVAVLLAFLLLSIPPSACARSLVCSVVRHNSGDDDLWERHGNSNPHFPNAGEATLERVDSRPGSYVAGYQNGAFEVFWMVWTLVSSR